MAPTSRYFRFPLLFTFVGLALACWLGWASTNSISGALRFLLIASVLSVLEISLSFDNAIVNANKLERMTPVWQRRFLTIGIIIAVFGMRIIFPLAIVVVAAGIGPLAALMLAASDPDEYARIIEGAHLSIAAFGGTFLMMVALRFFVDETKEVDWIRALECRLRSCAALRGFELSIVLFFVLAFALPLAPGDRAQFLIGAVSGLLVFFVVESVSDLLDSTDAAEIGRRGGLGAFLYLEVLDASFSFDGVVGAFALTKHLFLIAIGLGIGAFYVRSMTIMLVERKTLSEYLYVEHGAFYSILVLSLMMFAQALWHIPELVTGLLGAAFIGLAFLSSVLHRRRVASARRAPE